MIDTVEKLREEILQFRAEQPQGRFAEELRARLTQYAVSEMGGGASVHRVAVQLGISEVTLYKWLRKGSKLRAVTVAADAETSKAVLVTAGGHRVEGLSTLELARLIQQLGAGR